MSDNQKSFPPTLSGSILLTSCACDWDLFRMQFFDDWHIEVEAEPVSDNLIFSLGEVTITLSLIDALVPQAWETAGNNYLWPEAAEAIQAHQAHIVLGVIGAGHPLQRHILFTMAAASLLKQENAIGLFQYPVTRKASDYIEAAMALREDNFPVTIWVYAGFYQGSSGALCCYTYGLEEFEKEEIEILDSSADMIAMYQFIYQVIGYLIAQNGQLNDGEAIGFSKEHSYAVTRSEGAVMEGTTVKIQF